MVYACILAFNMYTHMWTAMHESSSIKSLLGSLAYTLLPKISVLHHTLNITHQNSEYWFLLGFTAVTHKFHVVKPDCGT